jgi:hypothetical protein
VLENWTTGGALRRYVDSLDPVADDEEITAQVSNVMFGDAYFAHSIYLVTFCRQAAVPAIAKVLYRSGNGDIVREPRRRNDDTIVFFTEFYRRGYKSEEGKAAVARMERIHSNFLIDDELKLYTLATVMFEPDRLAAQFGCDPFSDVDRAARWNFWQGFASAMPLELPSNTRAGFLEWMEDYERRTYEHTVDGEGIFEGLLEDWKRWYPNWVPGRDKLARQSLVALLDEPLREAMGQERSPAHVEAQVKLVAQAYLKSTPIRPFRRNRNLIRFFGKNHENARDLETVGYQPKRRASSETESEIAPRG